MQPIQLQQKLVEYTNAAADLAEHVRADIRRDGMYSNETVLKLSQFIEKAQALQKFIDILESNVVKLN